MDLFKKMLEEMQDTKKEKGRIPMKKDWKIMHDELVDMADELIALKEKIDFKRDRMWIIIKEESKHYGDMSIDSEKNQVILYK